MAERYPNEPKLESIQHAFQNLWSVRPKLGIVLGSGTGALVQQIEEPVHIPFARLPSFPPTTATGHQARWVCGYLAGQPIVALQGRYHYYEGHTTELVTRPIRLMHALGATHVLLSNAAGGLNPYFRQGDFMLLESHIDLMFGPRSESPLPPCPREWQPSVGEASASPSACCLRSPYCPDLRHQMIRAWRSSSSALHCGVYAGLMGPNYETRAEYRFLRTLGADAVGMSTIPEARTAAQFGMRVLACSVIANVANPDALDSTSGQEVLAAVTDTAPQFHELVRQFVKIVVR